MNKSEKSGGASSLRDGKPLEFLADDPEDYPLMTSDENEVTWPLTPTLPPNSRGDSQLKPPPQIQPLLQDFDASREGGDSIPANSIEGTDHVQTYLRPLPRDLDTHLQEHEGESEDFDTRSESELNSILPRIAISQMRISDEEEARAIGTYILNVLEGDLCTFFNCSEDDDNCEEAMTYSKQTSNASLDSNFSDPLPGEPSTLKLSYDYESSPNQLPRKAGLRMIDQAVTANIHRKRISHKTFVDTFTLTRDMTFLDPLTAQLLFRHNYPRKDDYQPPPIPSRQASLDKVLEAAARENPGVDRARIGPKIRWGKNKRILQPLPQNYSKEETFWTGSVFRGQYVNRHFEHGRFEYPLMSIYESEFRDGLPHTKKHLGCVTYPRGDKFEGEWVNGRHVSGKITFADDLEFQQNNWAYLQPPNRSFYIEKDIGIKEAGKTLFNDRFPPPNIPPGQYDTGYGIFNPETGIICGYGGEKLRDASYEECKWILKSCRRVKKLEERFRPQFNPDRIPGSSVEKFVKQ